MKIWEGLTAGMWQSAEHCHPRTGHTNSTEFHCGETQILNLVSAQTSLLMEILEMKMPHHLLSPRKGVEQHALAAQFLSHSRQREDFSYSRTSAGTEQNILSAWNHNSISGRAGWHEINIWCSVCFRWFPQNNRWWLKMIFGFQISIQMNSTWQLDRTVIFRILCY